MGRLEKVVFFTFLAGRGSLIRRVTKVGGGVQEGEGVYNFGGEVFSHLVTTGGTRGKNNKKKKKKKKKKRPFLRVRVVGKRFR